jgi:hypothetical protein
MTFLCLKNYELLKESSDVCKGTNVFCGEVKVTKKYISSLYFGSLLLFIDLDKIQ